MQSRVLIPVEYQDKLGVALMLHQVQLHIADDPPKYEIVGPGTDSGLQPV